VDRPKYLRQERPMIKRDKELIVVGDRVLVRVE
jgi:hypothetical protein